MTKDFWMRKMLPFLNLIKAFEERGEKAYEVREELRMTFLFDGGFKVSGEKDNVYINFDDPDLLILMIGPNPIQIYRIPYSRLVGFELITESSEEDIGAIKFFRN
jgi:hypothetical protein